MRAYVFCYWSLFELLVGWESKLQSCCLITPKHSSGCFPLNRVTLLHNGKQSSTSVNQYWYNTTTQSSKPIQILPTIPTMSLFISGSTSYTEICTAFSCVFSDSFNLEELPVFCSFTVLLKGTSFYYRMAYNLGPLSVGIPQNDALLFSVSLIRRHKM